MILYLHPDNPEIRKLTQISQSLKKGGVFIFPTDTVYALVADANSKEGTEKLYSLKNMPKNKPISLLCRDISEASQFIEHLPNQTYKMMKKFSPGPYTFILKANKNLPKPCVIHHKDRHIGIRFPDHIYLQELLKIHDGPLTSTSVLTNDEYLTDIDDLELLYGQKVEGVIDGGLLQVEMSTILDCTEETLKVVREGKGFSELGIENI
ncbi:L-threonylcarbamoyladenylate synthase [Leptospira sp. GIMC2001]|uniref:L-threonylcarbamoyladenylate synthase n=1 Tax=Leptospira sp. GIMC2001 TaxID=1513297 RepID=UPI00234A0386|nr:L-threonylcarbamoyladenylate synthase [Leptospira sp. GIMC2001]WCL49537.1 L-threonylcarbamoyladenylate synthase [Leptospira sp. GIMC2001]